MCIRTHIALSAIIAAINTINAVPRGASLAMVSQQLKSVRHLTIAHLQFDCREPKPSFCCWRGTIGICYEFSEAYLRIFHKICGGCTKVSVSTCVFSVPCVLTCRLENRRVSFHL